MCISEFYFKLSYFLYECQLLNPKLKMSHLLLTPRYLSTPWIVPLLLSTGIPWSRESLLTISKSCGNSFVTLHAKSNQAYKHFTNDKLSHWRFIFSGNFLPDTKFPTQCQKIYSRMQVALNGCALWALPNGRFLSPNTPEQKLSSPWYAGQDKAETQE